MVLIGRTKSLGTENAFLLLRHIEICRGRGMDVVLLNFGEPDVDTPEVVSDAAVVQIREGNTHYCYPFGIRPLREAIARHVSASREITARETQVATAQELLRVWSNQLRNRETELDAREHSVGFMSKVSLQPVTANVKVGRNQRCPCGSGLKFKRCHGSSRQV
ncbi:MAG: SEC-C metal-binding domain-containing protein [Acidimicrobiia bacterium]